MPSSVEWELRQLEIYPYYVRFSDDFHDSLLSAMIPHVTGKGGEDPSAKLVAAAESTFRSSNAVEEDFVVQMFPRLKSTWVQCVCDE